MNLYYDVDASIWYQSQVYRFRHGNAEIYISGYRWAKSIPRAQEILAAAGLCIGKKIAPNTFAIEALQVAPRPRRRFWWLWLR